MGKAKRGKYEKVCEYCKKVFYTNSRKAIFCKTACRVAKHREDKGEQQTEDSGNVLETLQNSDFTRFMTQFLAQQEAAIEVQRENNDLLKKQNDLLTAVLLTETHGAPAKKNDTSAKPRKAAPANTDDLDLSINVKEMDAKDSTASQNFINSMFDL